MPSRDGTMRDRTIFKESSSLASRPVCVPVQNDTRSRSGKGMAMMLYGNDAIWQ